MLYLFLRTFNLFFRKIKYKLLGKKKDSLNKKISKCIDVRKFDFSRYNLPTIHFNCKATRVII